MEPKLSSLLKKYKIQGISLDSRTTKIGDAFFAIKGNNFDGNDFIQAALRNAKIAFTDNKARKTERVFYLPNIKEQLIVATDIIYPKSPQKLIAVTGTNGKSSVVSYVYQILDLLGQKVASLGTLGIESRIKLPNALINLVPKTLTTYDYVTFKKILHNLALAGINNVAFEASSHGLIQNRLGQLMADTAAFTSFSQDHLDYHHTMEDYLQAKLRLFSEHLQPESEVVINDDIFCSSYGKIVKSFFVKHNIKYLTIKTKEPSNSNIPENIKDTIEITDIKSTLQGSEVSFWYNNENYKFNTNIIGSFQATNLLIAAKMVANIYQSKGQNIDQTFEQIIKLLGKVQAVDGRLQRIGKLDDPYQIFVDYAHTPDALDKSLSELKKIKHPNGKLYVVFGCGGDRDPIKRPLMAKVACKLADYVIVTDDNPRTENPANIRLDILQNINDLAEEIGDRKLAIETAIGKLRKNDILLIAGKGHEDYQIIGNKTIHFSDAKVAKEALLKNGSLG